MWQFYRLIFLIATLFCLHPSTSFAQEKRPSGIKILDTYLINEQTKHADSALQSQIARFKQTKQIDSLAQYTVYVGKVALLKSNAQNAANKAESFFNDLKTLGASKRAQHTALYGLSQLYEELGDISKSFKAAEASLATIRSVPDAQYNEIGEAYYALTYSYYISGKFLDANIQAKKAMTELKKSKKKNYKKIADVNNFFGIMMWQSQKLDSAQYFFETAIKTLNHIEGDSVYKVYSASGIKLNMALVMEARGSISESIQTLEQLIQDCNYVIKNSKEERVVSRAKRLQWTGLSNLGSLYTNIGHVNRAHEIMGYIYHNRDQLYHPGDPEIIRALILLAQSQMALKETEKAIASLEQVLDLYEADSSPDIYWQAIATANLAGCYDSKGDSERAEQLYGDAEKRYKMALGENIDDTYLDFARDKSLFLANNGKHQAAVVTALESYTYLRKNGGENHSDLVAMMLNISEVYYTIGDYTNAAEWSQKGIIYIDDSSQNKKTGLDALKLSYRKPLLLLAHSKALYKQNSSKDSIVLKSLLKQMDAAFKILDQQKIVISKDDNVNILYSNFMELFGFTKQLYCDLYAVTQNKKYLTKLIDIHENSIYYSIRSQLMLRDQMDVANVPASVIQREHTLKKAAIALPSEDAIETFQNYLKASEAYESFLDSLKTAFPKYYNMKYASLEVSLQHLQNDIPEHTTLVRYLFIDEVLYAMVFDKTNRNLIKLNYGPIENHIEALNHPSLTFEEEFTLLYELYEHLWRPLENHIHTENLIILPDGALFNLSFETLTPSKIKTYEALATHSLLAKHTISYNFSLLLFPENQKSAMFTENFVAFAPGFSKEMKLEYKFSIRDSLNKDATYLNLLSQPSSVQLAETYAGIFDGTSFLNKQASKKLFMEKAGEHKIIHIGTHGESNNISPEFSRLIFAKNTDAKMDYDENSLYTYEIYNTNLSSNLAILTACETGKPTYQPGEGMISLAHAFNYAGSESILTTLWEVDEISSTQIVGYFYDFLSDGLPKDEALKKAKLKYLSTAEGRAASTKYWAGLVLIGNTDPIHFEHDSNPMWWWVLGLFTSAVLVYFLLKRKKQHS